MRGISLRAAPAAFVLSGVFVTLALPVGAADNRTAGLTADAPVVTYTAGPFVASNPQFRDGVMTCAQNAQGGCDTTVLIVKLPEDTFPNKDVRIEISWPNASEDFDVYVSSSANCFSIIAKSNGAGRPEVVTFPAVAGRTTYRVCVIAHSALGGSISGRISLVEKPPIADGDGDGVPDTIDLCPGTPLGTPVDVNGCPIVTGDDATCTIPGVTKLTDASGDSTSKVPGTDLKSFQIAQPPQVPSGDRIEDQLLAFRINVDPGATPNPATAWFVSFNSPAGLMGVRMTGDNTGTPLFQTYVVGTSNSGAQDGRFSDGASPAHPSSTLVAGTGAITIVANATAFGITAAGQKLEAFNAGVTQTTGGVATAVDDGMPANDLSRSTASYTLHDNTVCGGPPLKPIGLPQPASGLPPRFYDFQSPLGLADSAGEPTVGYNPFTDNVMFIAILEVDRITYAEDSGALDVAGNPLPEACDPVWQDKSYPASKRSLDPILHTEQSVGRTFQSQLSGANSIFAFTDDDGDTWIPAQAGPPNGGVDHQTVGTGPWAPGFKPPSATEDYAVYYCSQSIAAAFCSRSDNGGLTFGPGIAFRDSATDCDNTLGGLHGHVQVAPDGTVYVPFGNCNDKVATAVSTDSGLTWTVKKIQPSTTGDDPGLGIASDGTLYMCYSGGSGGKAFATVSKDDRGSTWSKPYEISAAHGLEHTVFVTGTAGDPDRAACAFLGTSTKGNPQALDFPGIWYPYTSVTYDGGQSWHTVNAAPSDPVQGAGGICLAGISCGTNRNLLDFNDIIMSDEGRVLFGYADGCRGACVQQPSQNTFSANGVIARQSGGRTLLSAFDDKPGTQFSTVPIKPRAACASQSKSKRTLLQTRVGWLAPDSGGSAISNYKVFRATAATGPFAFVGDAGPATQFVDPTADIAVEKYYYKVVAENAEGAAPDSNVIELPIDLTAEESSCVVPGITVFSEGSPGECGQNPCAGPTDIQRIHVSELAETPDQIVLTIKVADLNPTPQPDTFWFLLTRKQNGQNIYLAMDTAQGLPRFTHGTYEGGTVTTFSPTEVGTIEGDWSTDGYINLRPDKSILGNPQKGDAIASIEVRTRTGQADSPSLDVLGPGDYILRGTEICIPNTSPVAILSADIQEGEAPLPVTFTVSGSDADSDALASFTLDFGDGRKLENESFGGQASVTVAHTYLDAGNYAARLTVTDSEDAVSSNTAEKVITVGNANLPPIANAGADFSISEGHSGLLSGAGSRDPEGQALSYEWIRVSGPAVTLANADTATASFTAPAVGSEAALLFRLTVTDPAGARSSDDITVIVEPLPEGNNRLGGGLSPWALLVIGLLGMLRRHSFWRSRAD